MISNRQLLKALSASGGIQAVIEDASWQTFLSKLKRQ